MSWHVLLMTFIGTIWFSLTSIFLYKWQGWHYMHLLSIPATIGCFYLFIEELKG